MIKQEVIDGQPVVIHYLTLDLKPASEEDAQMIKVHYPSGKTVWGFPSQKTTDESRLSWTIKTNNAVVHETEQEAIAHSRRLFPDKTANIAWSSSEGGFVIYNPSGTKMVSDR